MQEAFEGFSPAITSAIEGRYDELVAAGMGIAYVDDALLAEGFPRCYADNLNQTSGPTGLVRRDMGASVKPALEALRGAVVLFAQ